MDKRCGTCGWWDGDAESDLADEFTDYGYCDRCLGPNDNENQYKPGPDTRKSPMLAQDVSYCGAWLYTKSGHCCNEWKEKEDQNG